MQSLKELFRIGMGPSSSHTMGPRKAAEVFGGKFPHADQYQVTLYGSLAATGKGHCTDFAIIDVLGNQKTQIIWNPEVCLPFHPNGMLFKALNADGKLLGEWTVFSVGGGALREESTVAADSPVYPFTNFAEIITWAQSSGRPISDAAMEFEPHIADYLAEVWYTMKRAIEVGLNEEGVLRGGLHLQRKAYSFFAKARTLKAGANRTGLLSAYALAVSEQNAACGIVVTAPTCGSCGVVPAVLRYLQEELSCSDAHIIRALAVAGLIGNTAKRNGSISGAEVGCQGEIGVACAMASGAACSLLGGTPAQIEYAAEIGLEHFLGLTCDPVLGLVQIPCIERNAVAASRALMAAEYALLTDGLHRVSYDTVVKTMLVTGHDIPSLYRETSNGGLAKLV